MGMFDDVRFSYLMPDGFDGSDYQSKSLESAMDVYEITQLGRLIRLSSRGSFDGIKMPLGDINFKGELNIYTNDGLYPHGVWRDYNLTFVNGTLTVIKCNTNGVELVFEPCRTQALAN